MAVIAFIMWPFPGVMAAALKMANDLRERGHQVCFLGIQDCESFVEQGGFEFRPVFQATFPIGFQTALDENNRRLRGPARWRECRQRTRRLYALLKSVLNGGNQEIEEILNDLKPALVLVDSTAFFPSVIALVALSLGIPAAYFSVTVPHYLDSHSPPFTSSLIPNGTLLSKVASLCLWFKLLCVKLLVEETLPLLRLDIPRRRAMLFLAIKFHYPVRRLIGFQSVESPLLTLPELFVLPKEFDFPHPNGSQRAFLGAAVDLRRPEDPFDWRQLDENKPLIYCAIGTLLYFTPKKTVDFLQLVIDAVAPQTDFQLVLATGKLVEPAQLTRVREHIVVVQRAPQLALLKRAKVMITHGGLNSIKEAILYAVPLVVFPFGFDQPGNAARVVYHRLGVQGRLANLTAQKLWELVFEVYSSPVYRAKVAWMSRIFHSSNTSDQNMETIERLFKKEPLDPATARS